MPYYGPTPQPMDYFGMARKDRHAFSCNAYSGHAISGLDRDMAVWAGRLSRISSTYLTRIGYWNSQYPVEYKLLD